MWAPRGFASHIHVLYRDIPFMFMDTYPDLNVWAAATTALDSEAASELEDMFSTVSECSKNSLWKFEASE
jgi:hypothetical protein